MYFDITPTFLSDHRKTKFKCTIYNREGMRIRTKRFKDIYDAHNWGCRKINNSRV